jgi:polysaccharide export outer membrane protein
LTRFPASQKSIPVVYRANFTDPSSFFYAREFPMRNDDVIYISNAGGVELTKFLNLIGLGASTADTSVNTARAVNFLAAGK